MEKTFNKFHVTFEWRLIILTWSLRRWMILDVHSPLGMMLGSVRNRRRRQRAADCFTTSRVSLQGETAVVHLDS